MFKEISFLLNTKMQATLVFFVVGISMFLIGIISILAIAQECGMDANTKEYIRHETRAVELPGLILIGIPFLLQKAGIGIGFRIGILDMAILCCGLLSVIMIFREICGNLEKKDLNDHMFRELLKTIPGFILILLPYILTQLGNFR